MSTPWVACTIVSNNYLAYARVFTRSFLEQHPDGKVYVLIVDKPDPSLRYEAEPFEAVLVESLGIPCFPHYSFRYSILELNTAVKPWFLLYLHRTGGYDRMCYFDPDILVLGDLSEIYERLGESDVLLTPHITAPIEDDRTPSERDFLLSGIYNLGFLGVSFNQRTLRFLDWWHRRLYRECLHAVDQGLFVDQRWMDFAPAFLPRAVVHRDPGCNVAYWNLMHRTLVRGDGGGWWVGEVPLPLLPLQRLHAPSAGADLQVPEPLFAEPAAGRPAPLQRVRRASPGGRTRGAGAAPLRIRLLRGRYARAGHGAPAPAAPRSRGEALARSFRDLRKGQLSRLAARPGRSPRRHSAPTDRVHDLGAAPGSAAGLPFPRPAGPRQLRRMVRLSRRRASDRRGLHPSRGERARAHADDTFLADRGDAASDLARDLPRGSPDREPPDGGRDRVARRRVRARSEEPPAHPAPRSHPPPPAGRPAELLPRPVRDGPGGLRPLVCHLRAPGVQPAFRVRLAGHPHPVSPRHGLGDALVAAADLAAAAPAAEDGGAHGPLKRLRRHSAPPSRHLPPLHRPEPTV